MYLWAKITQSLCQLEHNRVVFYKKMVFISLYKSDCLYLCPLFTPKTARPISTKFCTDLHTNSRKVLNTSMTLQTRPLDPRVPQIPKPKWVTGEKTLCNVKCPDGQLNLIKFFLGWLVIDIPQYLFH